MAISNSMILQIAALKNVVKSGNITSNLLMRINNRMNNVSLYSTASPEAVPKEESDKVAAPKKMSKAMLAYLERAKAHDAFIKKEEAEYQIGKRHLANIMGEDPEHFTQKDIDRSIEYLFPSGLFDKAARPSMRPPSDIYPSRKAAEFDETGRPFHSLFYTTRPNFYQVLYDIAENYQMLNNLEDEMHTKVKPQAPERLNMGASEWYTYDQFNKFLLEEVTEEDYEYFISSIIRLTNHPYAYKCKDFIMKFRKLRSSVTETSTLLPVEQSFDGRPCVTARDCMRKSARGVVTVTGNGTGKITVNGQTLINYFPRAQDREQCALGALKKLEISSEDELKVLSNQVACEEKNAHTADELRNTGICSLVLESTNL